MWNKKAIKVAVGVIVGSVVIFGGICYKIGDNATYIETGKTFMLELEERENFEDITYQKKIDFLMLSLNEKTNDGGLEGVDFERPNGKEEKLSLEKNTKKYNLFREGMIEGMISETDEHIIEGISIMFEDDGDESEFYKDFKEESIEKYNQRYIDVMTEYRNVLLDVKKDFEDNKLKYTYTKEFEEVDKKYEDLMEDFAIFMASYLWDSMLDSIWDY